MPDVKQVKKETSSRLRSAEQATFLNIQKTADILMGELADLLKPHALSPTQYNVLRILRAAGPDGLACGKISDRMLTREPDMTRASDNERRATAQIEQSGEGPHPAGVRRRSCPP